MPTRIKFCGFTREQDARAAIELGADALGLVFFAGSKRYVEPAQLGWLKRLPSFVQLTGLFVNAEAAEVNAVLQTLPIELLQFHGAETPAFCAQFGRRYIKAVPMQGLDAAGAVDYMSAHTEACGFLLDNYGVSDIGGSGTAFDWDKIPSHTPAPLIMAGGLTAGNVGEVIAAVSPYGVDASSAIETSAGIKSADKMAEFITAVRRADALKADH
ncbi:MAG: phosphoribosylanthranilate isomerase [Gammaproteobacteria bacterium]|nr:MAG: phosphoribosylanthranilate isomerase [Gammaproteobacteria bacterium]